MRLTVRNISMIMVVGLLALSCQKNGPDNQSHQIELFTEVQGFQDQDGTKVSDDGTGFLPGDWIRVKVICPFTTTTQIGESTYGSSVDDFYLLKHTAASGSKAWTPLTSDDCCDIDANYYYRSAPSLFSITEAQPTPYVYTASTWSEEKIFLKPVDVKDLKKGSRIVNQFCNIFHADQSLQVSYRASDLLWAQQYMQTGSWNVHLSFHHVLSCIKFTVNGTISEKAILTIEGMPDIDQQEIVVGDYYAAKSKRDNAFGYKTIAACSYEENGKVLGICVNDITTLNKSVCKPFSQIGNNTTYRAYRMNSSGTATNEYRLIVPPVTLSSKAVIWLRDGTTRYTQELDLVEFEQGKLYNVTINLPADE